LRSVRTTRSVCFLFAMILPIVQLLYSYVSSTAPIEKSAVVEKHDEDPKTLLGLLERAAHMWPNNGIAFKNNGWDQKENIITYKSLFMEAKVKQTYPERPNTTNKAKVQREKASGTSNRHASKVYSTLFRQPSRQYNLVLVCCSSRRYTCSALSTVKQRGHTCR
jgi:hypothetical protein